MKIETGTSKSAIAAATLLALTLVSFLSGAARAAEHTLKFGIVTLGDMQHVYADRFKEVIGKATNGRIEVQVFPQGQLGSPQAHIEGLQLGTIQMFMVPADFFTGVDPRYGVFSIPLLFKDREQANKVLVDPALRDYILSIGEPKGLVGMTVAAQADSKYFAKKPLRKMSDFKGLKLRVNATPAERERMARLGASSVPMGLGEMITSLQNGVIDGTMSGISIYVNFNLQNIGKSITKTEDTMLVSLAVASKKWLDGLPADLRKIVVDEGRKMQPDAITQANAEDFVMTGKWKERGGEIITMEPAELALLRTRFKSIGDDVTKSNPAVRAFYERLAAASAKQK